MTFSTVCVVTDARLESTGCSRRPPGTAADLDPGTIDVCIVVCVSCVFNKNISAAAAAADGMVLRVITD